jgi:hypothetical protein
MLSIQFNYPIEIGGCPGKPSIPRLHTALLGCELVGCLLEGANVKIENGAESSQLSSDGGFVIVRVPVVVLGELPSDGLSSRFTLGSFVGRETKLLVGTGSQAILAFRIPKELFRPRERLSLLIFMTEQGAEKILWSKRYETGWHGKVPYLQSLADSLDGKPEEKL